MGNSPAGEMAVPASIGRYCWTEHSWQQPVKMNNKNSEKTAVK
jgi:hypothetical protein